MVDGAGNPRVGAWYKFSVKFQVYTCSISVRHVFTIVVDAHIVHVVGDKVVQQFVIKFSRKFEIAVHHTELIVARKDKMDGTLRLDVTIESHCSYPSDGGCVAKLLVEGTLVVDSCGKTESEVVAELGDESHAGAWRDDELVVPLPPRGAYAGVDGYEADAGVYLVGVLQVGAYVVAGV